MRTLRSPRQPQSSNAHRQPPLVQRARSNRSFRPLETLLALGTALALSGLLVLMLRLAAPATQSLPASTTSHTVEYSSTLVTIQPTFEPINAVQTDNLTAQIVRPNQLCGWPLVGLVTLGQLQPARWNVPGGQRPADALTGQVADVHGEQIITPLQFTRFVIMTDHRSVGVVTQEYYEQGGDVGADHVYVSDSPHFVPGEQAVVVFVPGVQPASAAGPASHTERLMVVEFAFPIDAQGRVVFQAASQADDQGNPAKPLIAYPLNDVVLALASCP